jgi:hypothetical protein
MARPGTGSSVRRLWIHSFMERTSTILGRITLGLTIRCSRIDDMISSIRSRSRSLMMTVSSSVASEGPSVASRRPLSHPAP